MRWKTFSIICIFRKKIKLPKMFIHEISNSRNLKQRIFKLPKFQIPEIYQIPEYNKMPNFQIPENSKLMNFNIPKK